MSPLCTACGCPDEIENASMNDMSNTPDTPLQRRLASEVKGDILFDAFSRGRYATDASIYQIMPVGAVVPETMDDAIRAVALAREERVTVLPRGGGTSQCGQTVNPPSSSTARSASTASSILDVAGRTVRVEPGIVLDDLNRQLKKHGLWYPVDVSTASRATIGGMTANNSCGGRSLRYGTMRDNVIQVEAALADGTRRWFGEVSRDDAMRNDADLLTRDLLTLGEREASEVEARFRRCSAASVATISTPSCRRAPPTTWRISSSARRARSPSPPRSTSSSGRCSGRRSSASAISARSTRRWTPPSISSR